MMDATAVSRAKSKSGKKAAPKVGFVSLGCAKALVDSERIITRLRAEGYAIAASYDGADVVVVNTCGFLDSAKAESLDAIGEAMAENGRVIVTGCFGVEDKRIRAAFPDVLAVTGPHQYEAVMEAVREAAPAPHAPFLDLVPPAGLRLTPAPLRLCEDLGGLQQQMLLLHHPAIAWRLASRPAADVMQEAEQLVERGVRELLDHQPGHQRLRRRPQIRSERMARAAAEGALPRPLRGARHARRLGAAALRLPLPACRCGAAADGRGPDPALSRHPLPACLARACSRPCAARRTRRRRSSASPAGARWCRSLPSAPPSSSASPARPRRISHFCSTG